MITTELYDGQGLGNQLWCYVTTRIIALKNGYDFGIQSKERFKGKDFMAIDFGSPVSPTDIQNTYTESPLYHYPSFSDIRLQDQKLITVPDGTKIDGLMQDELYIEEYKDEIRRWFTVKPEYDCRDYSEDNICVINFRGGGYARDMHFFLPTTYWNNCIAAMRKINPNFTFIVVSDDPATARMFFPDFKVYHWSIGKDYAVIKNARYLILSNSSFAWFPAWLSTDLKYCIAPKYWARHNISDGYWSLGYNLTKGWDYMDRKGVLHTYDACLRERDEYMLKNKDSFVVALPEHISLIAKIKNVISIYSILKKDFSALYTLRKLSMLYTVHGMLTLRDKVQSLFGRTVNVSRAPTVANISSPSSVETKKSFKARIKTTFKTFTVTQSYY
ncbi:MAG TPA: glycosyl transferase [Candidatus Paceibacterota bacterium]|nr:glycosyl transferase [Candidatus Paceibacterota bacterium]